MGPWLKLYADMAHHPKVLRLARVLKIRRPHAAGLVVSIWCYALKYAKDGVLTDVAPCDLADTAGWHRRPDELVTALVQVGLVDDGEHGLELHNFLSRAGAFKAAQYKRQRRVLAAKRANPVHTQGTPGANPVLSTDTEGGEKSTWGERDREREGERTRDTTPEGVVPSPDPGFIDWLEDWASTMFLPPAVRQRATKLGEVTSEEIMYAKAEAERNNVKSPGYILKTIENSRERVAAEAERPSTTAPATPTEDHAAAAAKTMAEHPEWYGQKAEGDG